MPQLLLISMDSMLHNGAGLANAYHNQINSTCMETGSQLHRASNTQVYGPVGARKRTHSLEKEYVAPLKRMAGEQGHTAEMPSYFMEFVVQMQGFQRDVCKKLEAVEKIDRMESNLSRKIDSLEERLTRKFDQMVKTEVGHLREEMNNDIKQLRDQIKGVETKQDTRQKDNCDVNVVIKNLPDNAGEDLDSVVNGLFIDGLQLREVAITKTRRLASRTANKPGIVIASLQTQEMRTKVLRAKKSLKDSRNQVFRKVYIDADKPHAIRNMEANFRTLMKGMNNDNMIMRGNRLTLGEPTQQVNNA